MFCFHQRPLYLRQESNQNAKAYYFICFMNNMLCWLSPPKRLFWPKQKGGCQVPTKHEQAPIVQQHKRKTGMERGRILKFIFIMSFAFS
jgi:hypothetical protein